MSRSFLKKPSVHFLAVIIGLCCLMAINYHKQGHADWVFNKAILQPSSSSFIGKEGAQLIVGTNNNPPLNYLDDFGRPMGLSLDVLAHIAKLQNWKLRFIPCLSSECFSYLKNGTIDILVSDIDSDKIALDSSITTNTSVLNNWGQVFGKTGYQTKNFFDLSGTKIGVVIGESYGPSLKNILQKFELKAEIIGFDTSVKCLSAITNHKVDYCATSRFANIRGDVPGIIPTDIVFSPVQNTYIVQPGKQLSDGRFILNIAKGLDDTLKQLKNTPGSYYYDSIDKWIGDRAKTKNKYFKSPIVFASIIAASFCLFVTSISSYFMRKRMYKKTVDLETEMRALQSTTNKLNLSEMKLAGITSSTAEGFWSLDVETGTILDINESVCSLLGLSKDDVIGLNPSVFCDDEASKLEMDKQLGLIPYADRRCYDVTLRSSAGDKVYIHINGTTIFQDGEPVAAFAFLTDLSGHKKNTAELHYLAHHDQVTGLPNKIVLKKQVDRLIKNIAPFSVILLDLDDFKLYNDTHGHTFGDSILSIISKRLSSLISEDDLLCRVGGDEFIIVTQLPKALVLLLATDCLKLLQGPFSVDSIEISVGASIGIAMHPGDGIYHEDLLRRADLAMYQSKTRGKKRISFYNKDMEVEFQKKVSLTNDLHKALSNDEFELFYQPQIDSSSRKTLGAEALLRWIKPDNSSVVPPSDFIHLLEETGLIVPVGGWVLKTACLQAKQWHKEGFLLRISVNISPRQFQEPDFVISVQKILSETDFDPSYLCLEITESLLVKDVNSVVEKIKTLALLGVRFSIDDFGTGYSSLSYMQLFPFQEIKIDRSFVANIPDAGEQFVIIDTILALARALKVETVAEGVETMVQANTLQEMGVDSLQGYYFGKPITAKSFQKYLESD